MAKNKHASVMIVLGTGRGRKLADGGPSEEQDLRGANFHTPPTPGTNSAPGPKSQATNFADVMCGGGVAKRASGGGPPSGEDGTEGYGSSDGVSDRVVSPPPPPPPRKAVPPPNPGLRTTRADDGGVMKRADAGYTRPAALDSLVKFFGIEPSAPSEPRSPERGWAPAPDLAARADARKRFNTSRRPQPGAAVSPITNTPPASALASDEEVDAARRPDREFDHRARWVAPSVMAPAAAVAPPPRDEMTPADQRRYEARQAANARPAPTQANPPTVPITTAGLNEDSARKAEADTANYIQQMKAHEAAMAAYRAQQGEAQVSRRGGAVQRADAGFLGRGAAMNSAFGNPPDQGFTPDDSEAEDGQGNDEALRSQMADRFAQSLGPVDSEGYEAAKNYMGRGDLGEIGVPLPAPGSIDPYWEGQFVDGQAPDEGQFVNGQAPAEAPDLAQRRGGRLQRAGGGPAGMMRREPFSEGTFPAPEPAAAPPAAGPQYYPGPRGVDPRVGDAFAQANGIPDPGGMGGPVNPDQMQDWDVAQQGYDGPGPDVTGSPLETAYPNAPDTAPWAPTPMPATPPETAEPNFHLSDQSPVGQLPNPEATVPGSPGPVGPIPTPGGPNPLTGDTPPPTDDGSNPFGAAPPQAPIGAPNTDEMTPDQIIALYQSGGLRGLRSGGTVQRKRGGMIEEGSAEDERRDAAGAKAKGMTREEYELSPFDDDRKRSVKRRDGGGYAGNLGREGRNANRDFEAISKGASGHSRVEYGEDVILGRGKRSSTRLATGGKVMGRTPDGDPCEVDDDD